MPHLTSENLQELGTWLGPVLNHSKSASWEAPPRQFPQPPAICAQRVTSVCPNCTVYAPSVIFQEVLHHQLEADHRS